MEGSSLPSCPARPSTPLSPPPRPSPAAARPISRTWPHIGLEADSRPQSSSCLELSQCGPLHLCGQPGVGVRRGGASGVALSLCSPSATLPALSWAPGKWGPSVGPWGAGASGSSSSRPHSGKVGVGYGTGEPSQPCWSHVSPGPNPRTGRKPFELGSHQNLSPFVFPSHSPAIISFFSPLALRFLCLPSLLCVPFFKKIWQIRSPLL